MKKPGGAGGTGRSSRSGRVVGLAVLGAAASLWVLSRVVVAGDSMLPTLEAGDRLVVLRRGHRRLLRPGDLVTVADPRAGTGRVLVKRLAARTDGGAEVTGDNAAASTDSRIFGTVPWSSVTGKVLYRYAPAGRTGRVR